MPQYIWVTGQGSAFNGGHGPAACGQKERSKDKGLHGVPFAWGVIAEIQDDDNWLFFELVGQARLRFSGFENKEEIHTGKRLAGKAPKHHPLPMPMSKLILIPLILLSMLDSASAEGFLSPGDPLDHHLLAVKLALPLAASEDSLHAFCREQKAWTGRHFPADPDPEIETRLSRWFLVDSFDPGQMIRQLRGKKWIETLSPNAPAHLNHVPNDPEYPGQWCFHNEGQAVSLSGEQVGTIGFDMGFEDVWTRVTNPPSPVLAVLDTGIDPDHPEFHGRILPGFNFITNLPGAVDDNGHGTAVASLIGAQGDNASGMAGSCWNLRFLPLKVFNSIGQGSGVTLANALNFARQQGAGLINFSGGMETDYEPAADLIDLLRTQGRLTIAAAGNTGASTLDFPARHASCVAVGAMSPCGEVKTYTSCDGETSWASNTGDNLFCVTPGVRLLSALRGGGYRTDFRGTSASTALLSGAIALLLQADPALSGETVLTLLRDTARDLGTAGQDPESGWGLPRTNLAMNLLLPPAVRNLRIQREGTWVVLEWDELIGANGYLIERASSDEAFVVIDHAFGTRWQSEVRELALGSACYRVRAVLNGQASSTRPGR
jgi:hypothetical protein